MNINPQKKTIFKNLLERLNSSSFNSDDIKILFIELRPYFKNNVIFEIASFFAHPEPRDRGHSFNFIERNYVKFGIIQNKVNLLSEIITKDTFEKIIIKGISDFKEKEFKNDIGISRDTAIKLLRHSYKEDKIHKLYQLNKVNNTNEFILIENIIKYTSTSIISDPAISSQDLFIRLKSALSEVNSILNFNYDIENIIKNNSNDIYLCIVYLLHYSEFIMWDQTIAKLKIRIIINYYNRDNKPYLYLFMDIPQNEISFSWDFIHFKCDLLPHIEQEQLVLITKNLDIISLHLYRDLNGILKIKILEYNYF